MILRLLDEAAEETARAVAYYEEAEAGLGRSFRLEPDQAVDRIVAQPLLYPARRDGLRRVNLSRFSFYVSYVVRGQAVWIIAVSHAARRPQYFRSRLQRGFPPG